MRSDGCVLPSKVCWSTTSRLWTSTSSPKDVSWGEVLLGKSLLELTLLDRACVENMELKNARQRQVLPEMNKDWKMFNKVSTVVLYRMIRQGKGTKQFNSLGLVQVYRYFSGHNDHELGESKWEAHSNLKMSVFAKSAPSLTSNVQQLEWGKHFF